jgi:hypothetical protein
MYFFFFSLFYFSKNSFTLDSSPEYHSTHFLRWGETANLEDLDIEWHIPSQPEIDYAISLLDRYLVQQMNAVNNLISAPLNGIPSRQEDARFLNGLNTLRNALLGECMSRLLRVGTLRIGTKFVLSSSTLVRHVNPYRGG